MKRKNEKVPEFDEIIFENRNKAYGAFDLRKRNKSTTSLSILGGIAFSSILMTAISFTIENRPSSPGPNTVIIEVSDLPIPEKVTPPQLKPPAELTNTLKNLKPEVIDDTAQITPFIPTADYINSNIKDGNINDTVFYTETSDPVLPAENKPFIIVEEMPQYPGGNMALLKYISENINYPSDAHNNNIQGKVILKFVVNADGSVDQIEVIRSIDPSLDSEAVRVIKTLPRFKPGKQGGVPVPVWFSIPVIFRIVNN